MTDVGYVVSGYTVILGGLAIYAVLLLRRLADAHRTAASLRPMDDRSGAPPSDPEA